MLAEEVEKTLKYARIFGLPLTDQMLHLWLISDRLVSAPKIKKQHPQKLSSKDLSLVSKRRAVSKQKLNKALNVARKISRFPFLKLVAVTGSVSIRNAKPDDDIDLMIVAREHTLWLIRPFLVFFLDLTVKRRKPRQRVLLRDSFCLNLWLDMAALAVPFSKRNLYSAHEVLQVHPILDRQNTYQYFLAANKWTESYLKNAFNAKFVAQDLVCQPTASLFFALLAPFNYLAYLAQALYMKRRKTTEVVNYHSAYFHPHDYSQIVINKTT